MTKQLINESDIEAVAQALREGMPGKYVEALEKEMLNISSAKYAVAFNSGTAAFQAAGFALSMREGDRVFCPPSAVAEGGVVGIAYGAKLHPIAVDLKGAIDLETLKEALSHFWSRGKSLIVAVHPQGAPLEMDELEALIKGVENTIVEDGTAVLGKRYATGEPIGSCNYSAMTVFNFDAESSPLSAQGGVVVTNDSSCAEKLHQFLKEGGGALKGEYRMHAMQAALAGSQLARLSLK
jgi:dTDP-4-amino-4,6-dideoxygalactose transaminase